MELERHMEEADFWDNADRAQESVKELKQLRDAIEEY